MLPTFNVRKMLSRSANVDPEDVLNLKATLTGLGHYKAPKWGITPYPDQGLFKGVEDFQKQNRLKVDGILKPGGPTEKKLNKTLARGFMEGEWDWMKSAGPLGSLKGGPKAKARPNKNTLPSQLASYGAANEPSQPEQKPNPKPDETRVAGLPLLLRLGVKIAEPYIKKKGPEFARDLGRLFGAAEAAKKLDEMTKEKGKKTKAMPRISITPPPPPLPPSEPPRDNDKLSQNEEYPANPPELPERHENIPPKLGDDFEIYPELDEEMKKLGNIIERKGNEETRQNNTGVAGVLEEVGDEEKFPIAHTGGARDRSGNEIKETPLRAPGETKSMKDGSWLDVTATTEDGTNIYVNTYDTRADSITPTTRERKAAVRVMRNKKTGDIFIMVPKPRKDEKINLKKLKEFLRPIVRELKSPSPKPKASKRWRQWDKK